MPNFFAFLAPVALLLPFAAPGETAPEADVGESQDSVRLDPSKTGEQTSVSAEQIALPFDAAYRTPVQNQVRIEQRVIVRISPRQTAARQNLMAELPPRTPTRYEERKMEKCVPISSVAGVQTGSGNRLLLYLRDRRIVTANLEKSCRARDFYSGFYVEQNKDGMLCVDRDKLQSRSGANCEVSRMRQLVAAKD